MRILHTADWHLGKLFYGDYLTDDQSYVLTEQLLPMIRDEGIDAVVLAGDVYDRSLPPADAVALFDEIATKITAEAGVPFFVISGNHDSAARLSFGSRMLEKQGFYIAGELDKLNGPVVLRDAYGPVAFALLPFIEPASARLYFGDDTIRSHEDALARLIDSRRGGTGMRTVCVAHAFVVGGESSDSERPLSIGGSDAVSPALFSDYTYTALGHLHGPQQVGGPNVRYAGSLLKYSFGERRQKKGAVVVDIDEKGGTATSFLPFSPRHDVRVIEGLFEDIMAGEDVHADDYILFRLTDTVPILDGMAKLRQKYPRAAALEMPNRQSGGTGERAFDLRRTTERQLFASFAAAMMPDRALTEDEQACMDDLWTDMLRREGDGLL